MFFNIFLLSVTACSVSYALFFPSLAISYRVGAIDYPNGRKAHSIPTARAGGFAFFAAFIIFLSLTDIDTHFKASLILSGSIIFGVGFLDDALSLTPFAKLTGQFAAASTYILINSYADISENTSFRGISVYVIKGIFTLLWSVFLANAINLSDGLNGLAGGLASSQSLCLSVLAFLFGNANTAVASLLLFATIVGFLPRNFPRAKIFMGDCGALFLGLILGELSSRLVFDSGSMLCLLGVLLIFRVPTYDTNISIVRRLLKRQNPFTADRGHFHHRLVDLGFTKECAALLLITVSLVFGLFGIILASM